MPVLIDNNTTVPTVQLSLPYFAMISFSKVITYQKKMHP